jgi:hypothetical protein
MKNEKYFSYEEQWFGKDVGASDCGVFLLHLSGVIEGCVCYLHWSVPIVWHIGEHKVNFRLH